MRWRTLSSKEGGMWLYHRPYACTSRACRPKIFFFIRTMLPPGMSGSGFRNSDHLALYQSRCAHQSMGGDTLLSLDQLVRLGTQ